MSLNKMSKELAPKEPKNDCDKMSDWLAEGVVVLGKSPGMHYLMKKGRGMPIHKPLEKDIKAQETQLYVSNTIVDTVWCFQGIRNKSESG